MKKLLAAFALLLVTAALPSEADAKCRCNDNNKGKSLSAPSEQR